MGFIQKKNGCKAGLFAVNKKNLKVNNVFSLVLYEDEIAKKDGCTGEWIINYAT